MAPRFSGTPVETEAKPRFQGTPVQSSQPEAWNPVLGAARSAVEGIPILGPLYTGAVDQLSSNIAGIFTGEDPAAMRDRVNARQEAFREEHPIIDAVAGIAGGTAAMAPLASTAVGAKLLGVAPEMALGARIGAGGVSGSVISGLDTIARGGTGQDASVNALIGGAIGGVAGGAAPAVGRATDRIVTSIRNAISPQSAIPGSNMSTPAREAVIRAMTSDGSLGQAGIENIARGGPNAMLADAGPNAAALLDTAIQRSGTGSRAALDAIEARASQANTDVRSALDAALGAPQGVTAAETGIRQGSAGARQAAYDAAYSSPIDYSSEAARSIEGLLPRVPQGVIGLANRMMALEGQNSRQIMAQIADDGSVVFTQMPDVRQLDYITRALNQAARSGEGQGALGGQTDIGRLYGNLARDIRDATRTAVPAYDEALRTAASPIQAREALRFGEGVLAPSVTRDQAREAVEAMTGPELAAARQGVRSYIDDVVANVRAVASDPNIDAREARKALQDLSSEASREKIRLLMNDNEATNRLFAELGRASQALQLRAAVATNSKTYARQAIDEAVSNQFDQGAINTLLQGKPVNAAQAAIQNITGRTPQGIQGLKDNVFEEIARTLVSGPDRSIDLLSGMAHLFAQPKPTAAFLPGSVAPIAGVIGEKMRF